MVAFDLLKIRHWIFTLAFATIHACSTPTTTDTLLEGDSVLADKQAPVILSPSATGGAR